MSEREGGQRGEGPIFNSSPLLCGCYVIECIIFQIKPCNLCPVFKYETQKVSFLPVKMSSFDHTDVLISELQ